MNSSDRKNKQCCHLELTSAKKKIMGIPILVLTFCAYAASYTDIRETPCMSQILRNKIPLNRSHWSGVIEMNMKCDEGYDYPLNTPKRGIFRCEPDNKPWTPSYIPDCNKKTVPTRINIVMGLHMDYTKCNQVKPVGSARKTLDIGPKGKVNIVGYCSKEGLEDCQVESVTPICSGRLDKTTEDVHFWMAELQPEDKITPYVVAIVSAKYKAGDKGLTVRDSARKLQESLDWTKSKLKAECPKGMLGLISQDGSILCRGCSLGYYLDRKEKRCRPCRAGYYMDETIALKCKTCPAFRNLKNKTTWNEIARKYETGSYSLIYCPSISADGKLEDPYAKIGKHRSNIIGRTPPVDGEKLLGKNGSEKSFGHQQIFAAMTLIITVVSVMILGPGHI